VTLLSRNGSALDYVTAQVALLGLSFSPLQQHFPDFRCGGWVDSFKFPVAKAS
jgi:hypothetical protein